MGSWGELIDKRTESSEQRLLFPIAIILSRLRVNLFTVFDTLYFRFNIGYFAVLMELLWIIGKWTLAIIGLLAAAAITGMILNPRIKEYSEDTKQNL